MQSLFAVVYVTGHQYRVAVNDTITTHKLDCDLGDRIYLNKVLLYGSPTFTVIGRPLCSMDHVRVLATVIEQAKAKKEIIFKFKPKKRYRRKTGHRQSITTLRINEIMVNPDAA